MDGRRVSSLGDEMYYTIEPEKVLMMLMLMMMMIIYSIMICRHRTDGHSLGLFSNNTVWRVINCSSMVIIPTTTTNTTNTTITTINKKGREQRKYASGSQCYLDLPRSLHRSDFTGKLFICSHSRFGSPFGLLVWHFYDH